MSPPPPLFLVMLIDNAWLDNTDFLSQRVQKMTFNVSIRGSDLERQALVDDILKSSIFIVQLANMVKIFATVSYQTKKNCNHLLTQKIVTVVTRFCMVSYQNKLCPPSVTSVQYHGNKICYGVITKQK